MDNLSLVKEWLVVDHEAPAAVYFDTENKPFVLYRNGHKVPLLASPFADNLGECLVYLDEAHTRGTDLKMEPCARNHTTPQAPCQDQAGITYILSKAVLPPPSRLICH